MKAGQASLEYLLMTAGVLIVAVIVGSAIFNAATSTAIGTASGSTISVEPNPGRLAFWRDWNTLAYVPGSLVSSTSIAIQGDFSAHGTIAANTLCLPDGCINRWTDVNTPSTGSGGGSTKIPSNLEVNSLEANYINAKQSICLNGSCITAWPAGGAAPIPLETGRKMTYIRGVHLANSNFCSKGFPFLDGITNFDGGYAYIAYTCEEITATGASIYSYNVAKIDSRGNVVKKWSLPVEPSAITEIAEINGIVFFSEQNVFSENGIDVYALNTASGTTTKIISKQAVAAVGNCNGYILVSDAKASKTDIYKISAGSTVTATLVGSIPSAVPKYIYCFPGSGYALLYDGSTIVAAEIPAGTIVFKTSGTLLKPYGDRFATYYSSTGILAGYRFTGSGIELSGFGPLSTLPSGGYELQDYFCTNGWLWTRDGAPAGSCPNLNQLVQGTGARYLARFATTGNTIIGGTLQGISYYSP